MLRGLGGPMPFSPPPARALRVPAERPPPRRPGAPWNAAASAPPAPSQPAATEEQKKRPPERPEAQLSRSWPSATLRRPPARRAPGPCPPRAPAPAGSGSPAGTAAPGPGPDAAVRSSWSRAPEAVPVVPRRHLEKPLLARRPRRPPPSPSADARRPWRGGDPRGPDGHSSGAPLPLRGPQAPSPRPTGRRRGLKVSLLNDQYKYDDVEYEEAAAAALDAALVRKCTEWLRGVESAAAARTRPRPLDALPHLGTL